MTPMAKLVSVTMYVQIQVRIIRCTRSPRNEIDSFNEMQLSRRHRSLIPEQAIMHGIRQTLQA